MRNTIPKKHLAQYIKLLPNILQVAGDDMAHFSVGLEVYPLVKKTVLEILETELGYNSADAVTFFERYYLKDNTNAWGIDLVLIPVYLKTLEVLPETTETNDGSILVAGYGGVAPYTFNLDAGAFQASGLFAGLAAGDYDVIAKDAEGTVCAAVTITVGTEA